MKTYFNFQQEIQSRDVSQAIALPNGIGPFIGFGDGFINDLDNTITLKPDSDPDVLPLEWLEVKDRINSRNIITPDDNEAIKFGCISRDGTMFTSTEDSIVLNISNNRGYKKEVMVFAYHLPVEEIVDNPVSFVAYWNTSDISFYDIFKKYQDVYYPAEEDGRAYDLEYMDPINNHSISFDYLDNQLEIACEDYHNSKIYMVPIGIYGTGLNTYTNLTEPFSIIPYNSRFPMSINYNLAIHNAFKKSIVNMEKKFRDLLDYDTIKAYIDSKIKTSIDSLDSIPSGAIMLWAGSLDSIPTGWKLYEPTVGRVVIGWKSGGISINGNDVLKDVGVPTASAEHRLEGGDDWSFTINQSNVPMPSHTHGMSHTHDMSHTHQYSEERVGWHLKNIFTDLYSEGNIGHEDQSRDTGVPNTLNTGSSSTSITGDAGFNRNLVISKMPPAVALIYIQKI